MRCPMREGVPGAAMGGQSVGGEEEDISTGLPMVRGAASTGRVNELPTLRCMRATRFDHRVGLIGPR